MVIVDCKTSAILDIRCSMRRPQGTQIGEQLFRQNLNRLEIITTDKCDWNELRQTPHDNGARPVIKHR